MTRKHILVMMALLAFGSAAVRSGATPLSIVPQAQPGAYQIETRDGISPDSVAVRTLGLNTRVGIEMFDQRAEVALDN